MTAKRLAELSGVTLQRVYYVARKIGRFPTIKEVQNWKQNRGRPIKLKSNIEKED
jgi:hypothetical protein